MQLGLKAFDQKSSFQERIAHQLAASQFYFSRRPNFVAILAELMEK